MHQSLVSESWTVEPATAVPIPSAPVIASVPGCVHHDLVRAGLVEHPNRAFAEIEGLWIGRADWRYRCVFAVAPALLEHDRVELVCAGLDTIAVIQVNGRVVGTARNMHHPHRFDVGDTLCSGANELCISFRGPLAYAEECERRFGARPVNGDWGPYAYVRKAACHFGWDWGPRAPTVGVCGEIGLHAWSGARLGDVRVLVREADERHAVVDVVTPIVRTTSGGDEQVSVVVGDDDRSTSSGEDEVTLRFQIDRPRLWWPRGLGTPALTDVTVALGDGGRLDRWTGRTGLRRVRLDTTRGRNGSAFAIEVNGHPIFCKGANWIPNGLFAGERTAGETRMLVERAADAEMNMLRVWGGGIYEPDVFYDACDELGIMVWQDFMFACATYPEEAPFPALIETEARHQVARLSRHPSIVLWCGGNENTIAYESWGWKEELTAGQTWGERYWLEWLPAIVRELDPTRPYWPDSPYSGTRSIHPNDPDHGDRHTWDAAIEGYRDLVPRFVSEFGHQAPPNWATWHEAVGAAGCAIDAEANRHRQRAGGGNAKQYGEPLETWFGSPVDFDEWHYLGQVLQARAMAIAIEWMRSHRPHCMGALFWQLNDVWAGHSWSALDSAYRRKPVWYAVRRAFAPRMVSVQPDGDRTVLAAVNDGLEPWRTTARVRRIALDGTLRAEAEVPIAVDAASAAVAASLEAVVGAPDDPRQEMVVVDERETGRAQFFFERDRNLSLPRPRFSAELTRDADDFILTVQAETVLRDIVLGVDRLDPAAEVDEHFVTLAPGDVFAFRIRSARSLTLPELTAPPVFGCIGAHRR